MKSSDTFLYNFYWIWIFFTEFHCLSDAVCPDSKLQVYRLCSKDAWTTGLLYLDFASAEDLPIQGCHCSLTIHQSGTLRFQSLVSSQLLPCGSQLVVNMSSSMSEVLSCSGNLTIDAVDGDGVLFALYRLEGSDGSDTGDCYVLSYSVPNGFTIACSEIQRITTKPSATSVLETTVIQTTKSSISSRASSTTVVVTRVNSNVSSDTTQVVGTPMPNQSDDTVDIIYWLAGTGTGFVLVVGTILGLLIFSRRRNKKREVQVPAGEDNVSFVGEEINIDEGDGLRENVSHHGSQGIYKTSVQVARTEGTNEGNVNVQNSELFPTGRSTDVANKGLIDLVGKQYVVESTIPYRNTSQDSATISRNSSEVTLSGNRRFIDMTSRDSILWRKSDSDDELYCAELQLDSGIKTVIMVENIQRAQKYEDKIRYSDIMTEL